VGPCELCSGCLGVEEVREKMQTAVAVGRAGHRTSKSCEVVHGPSELRGFCCSECSNE